MLHREDADADQAVTPLLHHDEAGSYYHIFKKDAAAAAATSEDDGGSKPNGTFRHLPVGPFLVPTPQGRLLFLVSTQPILPVSLERGPRSWIVNSSLNDDTYQDSDWQSPSLHNYRIFVNWELGSAISLKPIATYPPIFTFGSRAVHSNTTHRSSSDSHSAVEWSLSLRALEIAIAPIDAIPRKSLRPSSTYWPATDEHHENLRPSLLSLYPRSGRRRRSPTTKAPDWNISNTPIYKPLPPPPPPPPPPPRSPRVPMSQCIRREKKQTFEQSHDETPPGSYRRREGHSNSSRSPGSPSVTRLLLASDEDDDLQDLLV
ncbi:uncharacterized protein BT62DRAFT_1004550 [Guyanagaster necrorhizus]|uniref:Uncharacterized protein n=1 Tax=Guyanagaster necrorhizus TaxID=856835 RepID=A0A9P7VUL9_9AGAR|nr:uncharacterized protein BT62DRAFT_1004550 [Guyanagaster necrorhizus MCA 3950]KAG7447781.1 hypothetical protein BT62DRAFT_1004550 [Guyanagaster necrorhizus MCA 3950]